MKKSKKDEPKLVEETGGVTTLRVVREEAHRLMDQIEHEKNPERIRALGDILERLNERYERIERELLGEEEEPQPIPQAV